MNDEREKSVFKDAKVGDWIINNRGECMQIKSIDDGPCGGVCIGKYIKFFWSGQHITHSGKKETARMATAEEVDAWKQKKENETQQFLEYQKKEIAAEHIRNAAEDLLAACETVKTALMLSGASPKLLEVVNAAIAKARGK